MFKYGLIGKKLSHSFSKEYFTDKFNKLDIDSSYELIELETIKEFEKLKSNSKLKGLNVTIPYKETILPFLDEIDPLAKEIGAVNTVKLEHGKSIGFNTDYFGFKVSLEKFIPNYKFKALILGTGGASKATQKVLENLNIDFVLVSRSKNDNQLIYEDLKCDIIKSHKLIINTTPLGMSPNIDEYPKINYNFITLEHYCFDLIYNPEKTPFILKSESKGAKTMNGLEMLHIQAEKSWNIWNS